MVIVVVYDVSNASSVKVTSSRITVIVVNLHYFMLHHTDCVQLHMLIGEKSVH